MKFKSLQLANWGRYRNPQLVLFDSTNQKNIILIGAINDKGKTTLFYAINYVLYGTSGLRNNPNQEKHRIHEWVNEKAARSGDGEMFVELKVIGNDNKEYRIQRKQKFKQTPEDEEEINLGDEKLDIFDENGPVKEIGKASENKEDWIKSNILPIEASQFFLFDGEVIQHYMDKPEIHIQEAIHQVLGLTEIKNAETDLDKLIEQLSSDYTKKANASTRDETAQKKMLSLEKQIKENEESKRLTTASRNGAIAVQDECNKKLRQFEAVAEKVKRKEDLTKLIVDDEKEVKECVIQLREKRNYSGMLLLNPLLSIVNSTEETPPSKMQWYSKTASHLLEKKNKFDLCVCDTKIDEKITPVLESKILRLQENPYSALKRLVEDAIGSHKPDGRKVEFEQVITTLGDLRSRIEQNKSARETISKDIQDSDINDEAKALQARADEATRSLIKDESQIVNYTDQIDRQKRELQRLRDKVTASSASKELLDAKKMNEFASIVRESLTISFSEFFKTQKPELEKHISKVFVRLTNNPKLYVAMHLDDDFTLNIERHDPITGTTKIRPSYRYSPSPGASQIAATALLGGFNKFTTRKSPVVIDTPLARLDPIHRENLLEYYTEISEQVIILYQPHEIAEDDMRLIESEVASIYEIVDNRDDPSISEIHKVEK